jgi:prepilin signal peptidase PulO-like enzyme (type II secretory pathway)
MTSFLLFIFGLVIGSFLNVVSLRYNGGHFVLDPRVIGGRSHCLSCKKTLRWFELVPLVSFLLQGGRCRRCKAWLSLQYPIVEFISGLLFVFIPLRVSGFFATAGPLAWLFPALWMLVFAALLLISVIDVRTGIIPDELNVALGILAVIIGIFLIASPGRSGSLTGSFGNMLSISQNVWVGRVVGAAFGFIFFEFLMLVTQGKGIGMGDVKLALPLGLLFGWPDILPVIGFAFICGALAGVILIVLKKKTMRGALPFGPYLALGAALVFFYGAPMAQWYLHTIGL